MSTRPYFDAIARQVEASAAMPSARYVLPQFEERTAYGFKRQDPYAKLFEDRIVFMGVGGPVAKKPSRSRGSSSKCFL